MTITFLSTAIGLVNVFLPTLDILVRMDDDYRSLYIQNSIPTLAFCVANGYTVQSLAVIAFMKVERDRFNILKKGSRTGYFCDPQSTECSRM